MKPLVKDRGIEVLPLLRLKKAFALITATALSVAIWGLFAMWIIIAFKGTYDLMTNIIASLLGLVFAGSTTWDSICEWRKKDVEND